MVEYRVTLWVRKATLSLASFHRQCFCSICVPLFYHSRCPSFSSQIFCQNCLHIYHCIPCIEREWKILSFYWFVVEKELTRSIHDALPAIRVGLPCDIWRMERASRLRCKASEPCGNLESCRQSSKHNVTFRKSTSSRHLNVVTIKGPCHIFL